MRFPWVRRSCSDPPVELRTYLRSHGRHEEAFAHGLFRPLHGDGWGDVLSVISGSLVV